MPDAPVPPGGLASFRWTGGEQMLLDTPTVSRCGRVVIGRYGGHTGAGATKNEDGALVWCAGDGAWEFAVLLDAHSSPESAALVLDAIEGERQTILSIFAQPTRAAFTALQRHLLTLFASPEFRSRCREVAGEASCLIYARQAGFVWWLSIGDCLGYVFHESLARLGQFALNQRSFYEWIGEHNTFDLPVPCYTVGTRALLVGRNTLLLASDGLVEWGSRIFADPTQLYALCAAAEDDEQLEMAVEVMMRRVHHERARDSATVLAWRYQRRALPSGGVR
jgi:hypothetical protein